MANPIPFIGTSGNFKLSAPLDTLILEGDYYTCKAIRRISEYISNNDDVKKDVYDKYGISEAIFDDHKRLDVEIISLQSGMGRWVYVPSPYLISYPDPTGVVYRTIGIAVNLPSIPATTDTSALETDIVNLVKDRLGVDSTTRLVETSRPILIPKADHDNLVLARLADATNATTDRARYMKLSVDHQIALDKIAELEAYILTTI